MILISSPSRGIKAFLRVQFFSTLMSFSSTDSTRHFFADLSHIIKLKYEAIREREAIKYDHDSKCANWNAESH